jgi:hypothetical protein
MMASSTQMDEQNRLKGFLGTADEMTAVAEVVAPKTVEWVRSLTDAEIIPMGIKALGDIADDILVLDEIRQRFRKGRPIEGYANWTEFIEKNSKYGIRTVQKRLNTIHGVRPYEKFEPFAETNPVRLSTETREPDEPTAAPDAALSEAQGKARDKFANSFSDAIPKFQPRAMADVPYPKAVGVAEYRAACWVFGQLTPTARSAWVFVKDGMAAGFTKEQIEVGAKLAKVKECTGSWGFEAWRLSAETPKTEKELADLLTAAPAVEDDPELDVMFEQGMTATPETPAPTPTATSEPSTPKESDTKHLQSLFKSTNLEVKPSRHDYKYDLCGLSKAQLREIATLLVTE